MTDKTIPKQSKTDTNAKNDDTPPDQKKQADPQDNVVTLKTPPKMEYDADKFEDFIEYVFHGEQEGDNILTWVSKSNIPSYPQDIEKTLTTLSRSTRPFAFYFGTSTIKRDVDGRLYNRKNLFSALHVVVLDDIGTKIPLDKIPEDFQPNYIIETSEGNFQYGYVLEKPIRDLALAEALIHLVYTSGVSDSGGKMPTKVVRLPCGVNGKKGDKKYFKVNLKEMGGDYWTPEEILEVLDVGVTWEEVEKDVSAARGGTSAVKVGTSLWSPIKPTAASLNGIVDPMLEWLYENDYVINDNGDWVTIECPWSANHSKDGEISAGYSPIGRGGDYAKQRSFKCFHEHCGDKTIHDFLGVYATEGAPPVPVFDNVADLVANYALMTSEDSVYRIRGVKNPTSMKIGAFRNAYPRTTSAHNMEGKLVPVKEHSLWLTAPNRLTLTGRLYDPTSKERIVQYDGQQHLNTYTHPDWGNGAIVQKDVDKFLEFLEYLIPINEERDYFLQWLAAKVQNITFKGAALLMVAPTQGTGRTTLTDMLEVLFTPVNVSKVNFDTLLSSSRDGGFNEWQESIMVTCDEVFSNDTNKYKAYEALKDMFDPRPKKTLINAKYGSKRQVTLYTSYILLTNHRAAIGALGDDRRVYVISNTEIRNTPEYYTELNEWLAVEDDEGRAVWAGSVWRYLQSLTPDLVMLNAPVPETQGKIEMIEETSSTPDIVAALILEEMGTTYCGTIANDLILDVMGSAGLYYDPIEVKVIMKIMKSKTRMIPADKHSGRIKVSGTTYIVRLNAKVLEASGHVLTSKIPNEGILKFLEEAKISLKNILDNKAAVVAKLAEKLDIRGI